MHHFTTNTLTASGIGSYASWGRLPASIPLRPEYHTPRES